MPETSPEPKESVKAKISKVITWISKTLIKRDFYANMLMSSFILFTSIGAGMFTPALGFIVAGITCGLFGFLLGLE
jgi:hypothetical protein